MEGILKETMEILTIEVMIILVSFRKLLWIQLMWTYKIRCMVVSHSLRHLQIMQKLNLSGASYVVKKNDKYLSEVGGNNQEAEFTDDITRA